jgi:putative acetyltransferase
VVSSLVARREGRVVGHLLLSHARIKGRSTTTDCLALAPMAVVPEHQRQGIGTHLVERALDLARERGHGIVIVLGHPHYYPRFGFEPASARNIRTDYDAPDEAFMVLGLRPRALHAVEGVVEYAPEFDAVKPIVRSLEA